MSNTVGWDRLVIKGRDWSSGSLVDCENIKSITVSATLPFIETIEISNCPNLTKVVVKSHSRNASLILRSERSPSA